MKTVFLTGASGFVGGHLAKRLRAAGLAVRCLLRKTANRARLETLGVETVDGDLADLDALGKGVAGADTVIHVAGATAALVRNDFFKANQLGCRNLVRAILENSSADAPPTLVSVSSLAAAGAAFRLPKQAARARGVKYAPVDETFLPAPVSTYGKSKLAGERELLAAADRIPTTIVRPSIVFGEGDRMMFPLFRMVKRTPFFTIPGFCNRRFSFVYAEDLVDLILAAAEKGERARPDSLDLIEPSPSDADLGRARCAGAGIYLASHPETPFFSDFGRMLSKASGRRRTLTLRIPPFGVLAAGLFQEGHKKLTGRTVSLDWEKALESLGGPWFCSSQKAERDLAWRPSLPLTEELRKTADWYVENRWL